MKTCPHCDTPLAAEESRCPACGKPYWAPDLPASPAEDEDGPEEEATGCLPILFWPLMISLLVTGFLILSGFVINLLTHFENNQIKIAWILGSCAVGGVVYTLITKFKRK